MKVFIFLIALFSYQNIICQNIWICANSSIDFIIDLKMQRVISKQINYLGKPILKNGKLIIFHKMYSMDEKSKPKKKKDLKNIEIYDKSIFNIEYNTSDTLRLTPYNLYSEYVIYRINNKSNESFSTFLKQKEKFKNFGSINLFNYSSCYNSIDFDSIIADRETVSGGETWNNSYKIYRAKEDSMSLIWGESSNPLSYASKKLNSQVMTEIQYCVDHLCFDRTDMSDPGYVNHGAFYDLKIYHSQGEVRIIGHNNSISYQSKLLIDLIIKIASTDTE